MRRLAPLGVGAVFLATFLAAGCRGSSAADPSVVLRIGMGFGGTVRTTSIRVVREMLYAEPLVSTNWKGEPTASLAERWASEDGGRAVRFYLRRGVRFHDGSELTADVVTRSLQHLFAQRGGDEQPA